MQDKSVNSALLALRKQIIRGDLDGLAHVEALLAMRGVAMPAVLPAKRPDVVRRGHMAVMIPNALRDGPKAFLLVRIQRFEPPGFLMMDQLIKTFERLARACFICGTDSNVSVDPQD